MTREGGLQEENVMETVEWHVGKMEAELRQWGTRLDNLLAMADVVGTDGEDRLSQAPRRSQGEV